MAEGGGVEIPDEGMVVFRITTRSGQKEVVVDVAEQSFVLSALEDEAGTDVALLAKKEREWAVALGFPEDLSGIQVQAIARQVAKKASEACERLPFADELRASESAS